MDPLILVGVQFGTTVYLFMVPLTLGLGLVVTYLHRYVRTKKDEYKRTNSGGKLYLINFAMGVATGLVQESVHGVSEYSRFVGDVFGAPLAMEASSPSLSLHFGLWIFGQTIQARNTHSDVHACSFGS